MKQISTYPHYHGVPSEQISSSKWPDQLEYPGSLFLREEVLRDTEMSTNLVETSSIN